jgi:hypothetical protein
MSVPRYQHGPRSFSEPEWAGIAAALASRVGEAYRELLDAVAAELPAELRETFVAARAEADRVTRAHHEHLADALDFVRTGQCVPR